MRNKDGNSALHLTVRENHANTVKALMKYSPVSCKNNEQRSALDLAREAKHNDIVSMLENYFKTQESQQATGSSQNKVKVTSDIQTKAGVILKSHTTTQSTNRAMSGVSAGVKEQTNVINQKKETGTNQDRLMVIEKQLDKVLEKMEKFEIQHKTHAASVDTKADLMDAVSKISKELDSLPESTGQTRGGYSIT